MDEMKHIAKWGFGMAPISARMRLRYDAAVQTVSDFLCGNLALEEIEVDQVSELKGMLNRCVRQDQWDWFSVHTELGQPARDMMTRVAGMLLELRRQIAAGDNDSAERLRVKMVERNLLHHLETYQSDGTGHLEGPDAGWVYVLSTREEPSILKIGMTRRSVAQRVREINSATGMLFPLAARQVFRVRDAAGAEKAIFQRLAGCRIRPDREFFRLRFSDAVSVIQDYISESRMRYRHKGTVLWFDRKSNYGFISMADVGDVFLHSSQIAGRALPSVVAGSAVEFDIGRRPQGAYATDVELIEQP